MDGTSRAIALCGAGLSSGAGGELTGRVSSRGGELVGVVGSQVSAGFLKSRRVESADRARMYEVYVGCIEAISREGETAAALP